MGPGKSAAFAATALLLFAGLGWGQGTGGTVTGTVTDLSGAAVPKAHVTLANAQTGTQLSTDTTSAGEFVFPVVPIGTFRLSVEAPGLATTVVQEVSVNLNATTTLKVSMQVASAATTINVEAQAITLQTDTSQNTTTVTLQQYNQLPLALANAARSVTGFDFLVPGVTTGYSPGSGSNSTTVIPDSQTFSTTINGGQQATSEIQIDGASIQPTNWSGDFRDLPLPVDAVSEFTLVTNIMPAQYGRANAVFTFISKSGTNSLHGDLYDYLRNTVMDARGFYPASRPADHQNEYGLDIGGPLWIPKVYNGKNKTFWNFYWASFRYRSTSNGSLSTLPTLAERNGDFSAFTNASGSVTPIYDPLSTVQGPNGSFTRTQFPGNKIPASQITGIAARFNGFLPVPINGNQSNNFYAPASAFNNTDRFGGRLDHEFSQNNRASFFFAAEDLIQRMQLGSDPFPVTSPLNTDYIGDASQILGRLGDTWNIRPNLVNQATFGYFQNYNPYHQGLGQNTNLASTLGIAGVPGQLNPGFSFGSPYPGTGTGDSAGVREYSYVVNDFISWTTGRHTWTFGLDFRRNGNNNLVSQPVSFNFSSLETALPGSLQAVTGNGYASFLLGAVDNANQTIVTTSPGTRYMYLAEYAQDDFKVSDRLTLNLGVRYELPWTLKEQYNRLSTFSPVTPNPAANGELGALIFAGTCSGCSGRKRFANLYKSGIQPRIGFAYRIGSSTVARGGYAIYNAQGGATEDNTSGNGSYEFGFNNTVGFSSLNSGITPAFYLQNGFPQNFQRPPLIGPSVGNGQGVNWLAAEDGNPGIVQNWSIGLQHQFKFGFLADASYVATKGNHLVSNLVNPDQVNPSYLSLGSLLNNDVSSSAAVAAGILLPYPGFTGSVAQALRPYPQFNGIGRPNQTAGNSTYNALQLKVQKRLSNGFSILGSYTFSKWLTDSPSQASSFNPVAIDTYNRKLQKSVAPSDQTQVATLAYTYELPFGNGKPLLNRSGLTNAVVGGWSLSLIQRYSTGVPLSVTLNNTLSLFNGGNRPNLLSGVPETLSRSSFDPAINRVVNINAFAVPAPFTFGDAPSTLSKARGLPLLNEDASLAKNFKITERVKTEIRFQVFNIFNRTQFGNINLNLSDPASFGLVTSQLNDPRRAQVGAALTF